MDATNNWRTLHGRASDHPGMPRTIAFGYVNKVHLTFRLARGTMVATNNCRTLHGRASDPPGMPRNLAFGYVKKNRFI